MTSTSAFAIQSVCDTIVIHLNQQALSHSQSGSGDYLVCSRREEEEGHTVPNGGGFLSTADTQSPERGKTHRVDDP